MAMHIRSERTHALVKEIAQINQQTQEDAALAAAEHYLRALRGDARADQIAADGAAIGRLAGLRADDGDPTSDLYDDDGLPA